MKRRSKEFDDKRVRSKIIEKSIIVLHLQPSLVIKKVVWNSIKFR